MLSRPVSTSSYAPADVRRLVRQGKMVGSSRSVFFLYCTNARFTRMDRMRRSSFSPPLFPVLVRSDLSKRERNPQIWWKALQQMHQEKGDLLFRFASFPLFVFFPFELYQREKVYPKLTPTHILCFPPLSLVCMSAYVRGVCLCVLVRFFFFFILLCLVSFAFSSFLSASFSFFFRSIPFFVLLLPLRARVHVC